MYKEAAELHLDTAFVCNNYGYDENNRLTVGVLVTLVHLVHVMLILRLALSRYTCDYSFVCLSIELTLLVLMSTNAI